MLSSFDGRLLFLGRRERDGLGRMPTPIFSMWDRIDGMIGVALKSARLLLMPVGDDEVALVCMHLDCSGCRGPA